MTKLESIRKHGVTAEGRRALMNYLKGRALTLKEAVLARCYDCMSYYADGIADCRAQDCPLYAYMPYRKVRRTRKLAVKDTTGKRPAAGKGKPALRTEKGPKTPKAPKNPKTPELQRAKGPAKTGASRDRRGSPKALSLFGQ